MRVSTQADKRMVAGMEAAMNGGYTGDVVTRLDLLTKFFALPLSLREKILMLRVGNVALLNAGGTLATRVFSLSDNANPLIGVGGQAFPVTKKGGLSYLGFTGLTKGMASAIDADFLAKITGISGLFFGVVAKKTGNQSTGATTNPTVAARWSTNDALRPEFARIGINASGDWVPFLRVRPENTTSYTSSGNGATKYGAWDWVFVNAGVEASATMDFYINTVLKEAVPFTSAVTTYLGTGAFDDMGRNSTTDAATTQMVGDIYLSIIGRARLTVAERAALDALMMADVATLNA